MPDTATLNARAVTRRACTLQIRAALDADDEAYAELWLARLLRLEAKWRKADDG